MTTDLTQPTTNLDALLDSYDGDLPEQTGTGLGTCYWLHGSNKGGAKTPGVLYIKESEVADEPAAPWTNDNRYEEQETPERGFSAAAVKIAPIVWHSQWYMPDRDDDGQPSKRKGPKKWITGYEAGAQKHMDLICLVEGLSDPVVFSADGQNKCGAMLDILSRYRNGLLRQATMRARKSGRKTPPPWAYWLPIANKRTADGKVDYVKVFDGSGKETGSVVTPPALFLPPDAIDSLLVTPEQFRTAAEMYFAFQEWSKEPRVYVEQPQAQLTSGRNVPQEIEEAVFDEPF